MSNGSGPQRRSSVSGQGTSAADRAAAWSRQLARAHDVLREQLRSLRPGSVPRQAGDQLLTHCLAFCAALAAHHDGEDTGMFAELLRARPDLRPVVSKLAEDHRLIAGILASVRDLAREAGQAGRDRRKAIGRELDGLAAIMESHFRYEERALGHALDEGVRDTGWATAVFGLADQAGGGGQVRRDGGHAGAGDPRAPRPARSGCRPGPRSTSR